jgi:hypothetical protein
MTTFYGLTPVVAGVIVALFHRPLSAESRSTEEQCAFSRGTTTCTSTSQRTEVGTHQVFSGCLAGPTGQPGRRVRTFEDTYTVTTTTITRQHGRNGRVYDTTTSDERVLTSSREISSVCEAI